jgi:hypothetical protein
MASDLETNGRPRVIGWHGTNTAGFRQMVRYPCRWRGRVALCTNGMGDSLRYVLAR